MFDIGGGEFLLIVVVFLLLFGPKKLPEMARTFGKGLRQFRKAQADLAQQIRDISADAADPVAEVRRTIFDPNPVTVARPQSNVNASGVSDAGHTPVVNPISNVADHTADSGSADPKEPLDSGQDSDGGEADSETRGLS